MALAGQSLPPPARPARDRIVDALREAGGALTVAEIAEKLAGVPERTRNHGIRELSSSGVVERVRAGALTRIVLTGRAPGPAG